MFKQSQTEVEAYLPDDVWYELHANVIAKNDFTTIIALKQL